MITFFTVPKPPQGDIKRIQNQAIASWGQLPIDKEIILFWDGMSRTNARGTPLLNDVFQRVAEQARHDTLVYVNADILFTSDLLSPVQLVRSKLDRFLIVGQRTDIPYINLDIARTQEWDDRLRGFARSKGQLHPPSGIDYFVFRREMVKILEMPAFAVGRPAWDNWLIARCLELGYPVVDATRHILALHQDHGFQHVRGGRREARHGPEALENRRLAGDKLATIENATHRLEDLL